MERSRILTIIIVAVGVLLVAWWLLAANDDVVDPNISPEEAAEDAGQEDE